jgi:hypothetical protein
MCSFSELEGKYIYFVVGDEGSEELYFYTNEEQTTGYKLWHQQDCCESVQLEDVIGSLEDLENTEIIEAKVLDGKQEDGKYGESMTWTFYDIRTNKGSVTLRWLGVSNGYYSESVEFSRI